MRLCQTLSSNVESAFKLAITDFRLSRRGHVHHAVQRFVGRGFCSASSSDHELFVSLSFVRKRKYLCVSMSQISAEHIFAAVNILLSKVSCVAHKFLPKGYNEILEPEQRVGIC